MLTDKLFNLGQVAISYVVSLVFRHAWHSGMPVALSVEPANICTLRCPECPAGRRELTRPRGFITGSLFRHILEESRPALAYLTFYFQGEPFLHPGFFDMVREAAGEGLYISTSTNGHFLDEKAALQTILSGLDRLIVSYDGADQESYAAYRQGGELERVRTGIRNLVKARKKRSSRKPRIVLQCLVFSSNEHQLDQVRIQGKELGADQVVFKSAQFYEFEEGNELMPEDVRHSRYQVSPAGHRVDGSPSFRLRNPLRNSCFRMWSSCVVTWDGQVLPCCFDKDARYVMGNLNQQSLKEIWNGEKYREFRNRVFLDRKSIDICRNCTQKW